MGLMFTGIILNIFMAILFISKLSTEMSYSSANEIMIMVILLSCLFTILGGILAVCIKNKIGPILVIIGSVLFIPLGMVTILGAIKVKNNRMQQSDIEIRRQLILKEKNHE